MDGWMDGTMGEWESIKSFVQPNEHQTQKPRKKSTPCTVSEKITWDNLTRKRGADKTTNKKSSVSPNVHNSEKTLAG